jgi:arabinogalactan endo-1,4-beta-galactosidase
VKAILLFFGLAILVVCNACGGGSTNPPPPPENFTLTVTNAGTGSGTVTSAPAGITCPGTCAASYSSGTGVTLTQVANAGSTFGAWSGACTGSGSCSVTMSAAKSVTATFNANQAANPQPTEPTEITPINGEVYYALNQLSGLQADTNASQTAGSQISQQTKSFTKLGQRWAFTSLSGGSWKISNVSDQLCLDGAGGTTIAQNSCDNAATQQWLLTSTGGGYYSISNVGTGLLVDVASSAAGAALEQTALAGNISQSQQWLLRPAFFRGVDNALLEKQEAARAASNSSWWKDAGQQQDILQIMKNHGVNMIRLRPSSIPPYATQSSTGPCIGNLCYAETEAQDLDLAMRAKNLGLSVELSLLFDGGSSSSVPASWTTDSFAQLQTDLYAYVKQEIEIYRASGVMPDLVSIGNEVDTGFLGPIGSPSDANFPNFAALQKEGLHAVADAAADTSLGAAIPAPLTCIHITPAWDLTAFFTLANQNGIQYDAICQSYYPLYHGPLTDVQAAASNPSQQPVEQDVLIAAANNLAKPIFNIETGEHYENGFGSNDPWYFPPSQILQRQFLIDLQNVQKALPNNLGMGIEYWDAEGVNVANSAGGFVNGDNQPSAIYSWSGLTIFDNADTTGTTNVTAANYSATLPGLDALGGKLDPTLAYKFVNRSTGQILEVYQSSTSAGAMLNTVADNGNPGLSEQWSISNNNDGFFQIASLNPGSGAAVNVLDDSGGSTATGNAIVQSSSNKTQEQEWNIVTAGSGYFTIVNRLSGLALDMNGGTGALAGFAVQETVSSGAATQQWQIVTVH